MFLTKTSVKKLNTPDRKIREAKFPFKALPLLIAGLVLGFCWLLTLARSPLYLDIGGEDRQDVLYLPADSQGFFAPETHPDLMGDATFRWMGKEASLNLPWPLDAVPLKISLQASAPRLNRFPDQVGTTLSIRKDGLSGIEPGQLDITGEYSGKVYEVTLPGHFWPGLQPQNLHFETSDTFQPGKGDPRLLGLVIFDLTIEPDYPQFGLGAWLATLLRPLLLAGLTLLVWWLARLFSLTARWQITLQVITGFLLIISLLYLPLAAEPVYAGWSVLLLAFGSMIWLGAQFAHLALKLPPIFVYIALFLPLMPLAQWLFSGLDLTTISPASAALFLYFAALAVAVMGYIFYRCKFEQIFLGSFLLVSLLLFVYNHWWVFSQNLYKGGDFRNYYQPLLESSQIESPLYSLTEMVQVAYKAVRMPPSFALLIWPYLKIFGRDVNSALFAWRISSELLLIPTVYLLIKISDKAQPGLKMGWVIIFLTLNFNQFAETVAYGQFNILILFGLTVMTYFLYCRREDYLVGAALALPAMIKLLPGLCAVYFIFAKRCRSLGGFVAGSVITGFLTIWVVGWNNVWFYFSKALWSVNAPELGAANQSWWGFLGRLSTNEVAGDFKSPYPQGLALWGYGGVLLGLTLTIIIIWRVRHGTALNAQLALGALILLSLLISPFSWMHYIVQGFGAILAIIVGLSREGTKKPLQMLTALCFVLLAYGGRNDFFAGEIAGLARLSSSYRFFATFTLWLVCLWLLVKPDDNESLELRGNALSRFKGRANSKQKWIV